MQHREADMETIIKRFTDVENKGKSFNTYLIRSPGKRRLIRGDRIFEERMARKLLELMKKINFQI